MLSVEFNSGINMMIVQSILNLFVANVSEKTEEEKKVDNVEKIVNKENSKNIKDFNVKSFMEILNFYSADIVMNKEKYIFSLCIGVFLWLLLSFSSLKIFFLIKSFLFKNFFWFVIWPLSSILFFVYFNNITVDNIVNVLNKRRKNNVAEKEENVFVDTNEIVDLKKTVESLKKNQEEMIATSSPSIVIQNNLEKENDDFYYWKILCIIGLAVAGCATAFYAYNYFNSDDKEISLTQEQKKRALEEVYNEKERVRNNQRKENEKQMRELFKKHSFIKSSNDMTDMTIMLRNSSKGDSEKFLSFLDNDSRSALLLALNNENFLGQELKLRLKTCFKGFYCYRTCKIVSSNSIIMFEDNNDSFLFGNKREVKQNNNININESSNNNVDNREDRKERKICFNISKEEFPKYFQIAKQYQQDRGTVNDRYAGEIVSKAIDQGLIIEDFFAFDRMQSQRNEVWNIHNLNSFLQRREYSDGYRSDLKERTQRQRVHWKKLDGKLFYNVRTNEIVNFDTQLRKNSSIFHYRGRVPVFIDTIYLPNVREEKRLEEISMFKRHIYCQKKQAVNLTFVNGDDKKLYSSSFYFVDDYHAVEVMDEQNKKVVTNIFYVQEPNSKSVYERSLKNEKFRVKSAEKLVEKTRKINQAIKHKYAEKQQEKKKLLLKKEQQKKEELDFNEEVEVVSSSSFSNIMKFVNNNLFFGLSGLTIFWGRNTIFNVSIDFFHRSWKILTTFDIDFLEKADSSLDGQDVKINFGPNIEKEINKEKK